MKIRFPKLFSPKPTVKSASISASRKLDSDGWWSSVFGLGGVSSSGISINEESALFNSSVFACERAISESLALLPRDIVKKTKVGRESISGHASDRFLTLEANPLMTSFAFFRVVQHHALSYGNGYAELEYEKGTGRIINAWPIPSPRVTPVVFENASGKLDLYYEILLADGGKATLNRERVLHIPGLGFDGIKGYPVIQLMANAIGLGLALEEFGARFFKQGAEIGGYIQIPDEFDENKLKNLRTHYDLINSGLDNAHRYKFLYESAKFTPSGAKPEESQMLGSRIFQIQEVARYYRIPLHKIQELSKSPNHNSLEQFNNEFYSDTLMPWITIWEQELNRKIFNDPKDNDLYVKFNVNALLRGDIAARSNFYRTMVLSGIMTVNEARSLEDLPPVKGGDNRQLPLNMTQVGSDKSMDAQERVQD